MRKKRNNPHPARVRNNKLLEEWSEIIVNHWKTEEENSTSYIAELYNLPVRVVERAIRVHVSSIEESFRQNTEV